jgi:hypothetical protein
VYRVGRRGDQERRREVLDPARHLVPAPGGELFRQGGAQRDLAVRGLEGVAGRPEPRRPDAGLVEQSVVVLFGRVQRIRPKASPQAIGEKLRNANHV